jgi:hypothetical protein
MVNSYLSQATHGDRFILPNQGSLRTLREKRLDWLQQAGLLDAAGKLHVSVVKLPHHGSRNNTSKEFLLAITADQYIVSASGRYGNTNLQTLGWIAEVAKEQGRTVEIILINHTSSVDQLLAGYDPAEFGYSFTEMPQNEHVTILEPGGQKWLKNRTS